MSIYFLRSSRLSSFLAMAVALWATAPQELPAAVDPSQLRTYTFYIEGIRTERDVEIVKQAVSALHDVTAITELTPMSAFANITSDHKQVTHQEIAEAIAKAGPYRASLRVEIPEYAKFAREIDAIFHATSHATIIKATGEEPHEFTIWFKPIEPGQKGFNLGDVGHPIVDPPPKGLGLKWRRVTAGTLARPK